MLKQLLIGSLVACGILWGDSAIVSAGDMAPAEIKLYPIGMTTTIRWGGGTEDVCKVTEHRKDQVSWQCSSGCNVTRPNHLAPPTAWENCIGAPSTGSQILTVTKGELWPLKVGNKQEWEVAGANRDGLVNWNGLVKCDVSDTDQITVEAGKFDVFKVVCLSPWWKQVKYYAPAVAYMVRWEKYGDGGYSEKMDVLLDSWELTSEPSKQ